MDIFGLVTRISRAASVINAMIAGRVLLSVPNNTNSLGFLSTLPISQKADLVSLLTEYHYNMHSF